MSSLPHSVYDGVLTLLKKKFDQGIVLKDFAPIGGGCINIGGKLNTSEGYFFLKWNDTSKFPGMFEAEVRGLKLLLNSKTIRIPEVIGANSNESYQFIVMEFIESHSKASDYWELLGCGLAAMHKASSNAFGLDHDNYLGSLPQFNAPKNLWIEFFITQRLQVQLKTGVDSSAIDLSITKKFEELFKKLPSIIIEEKPSLLHGDLWNGNLITDDKGLPCLIDPAVYFGNREVDLAMTQLFGGFTDVFYKSYQNAFPLERGFQDRPDIYNLYPLLVHVNLFGQGYLSQVVSILNKFT
jgi:fructosamine-3-kinase